MGGDGKLGMPVEFYADEIEVRFDQEPVLEKKPGVPSSFVWRDREYVVSELLKEWHDYRVRGKTKAFYKKERGSYWVKSGGRRGSWGVGRDFYRVRAASGDIFEIYYDRAPKGSKILGQWIMSRRILDDEDAAE